MLKHTRSGERMEVCLSGEIDHHSAEALRREIEELIADRSVLHLVLDFDAVSFMDSSGIGMIIGRYKTMKARGGAVTAAGLHPPIERVFRLAGLHRIIPKELESRRKEA